MAAARSIKLVVIGDGAIGKTCLLIVYANDRFPEEYVPTVFDNYVVSLKAGAESIDLALWDTAGQEEYDRLRPLSYGNSDVFLVCFSVANPVSYQNVLQKWLPEMHHFCPGVPFVLVGTKKDLRKDDQEIERLRALGQEPLQFSAGTDLAKKTKASKYVECSARTRENIKAVFDEAIKAVVLPKTRKKFCVVC